MNNSDVYLKAMMSLIARQTFSPERLRDIVSSRGTVKLLKAFNLCNGSLSQSEVAAELEIDKGQFSRAVNQWIDDGVIIRVGEGKAAKLVHVYPIPDKLLKPNTKKAT